MISLRTEMKSSLIAAGIAAIALTAGWRRTRAWLSISQLVEMGFTVGMLRVKIADIRMRITEGEFLFRGT
jgi:hypothetical protein